MNSKSIGRFTILFFGIILSSCFGLGDSTSTVVTGRYTVISIDVDANQSLSLRSKDNSSLLEEIFAPYVFAVGHNDEFIIVKQHPSAGFDGNYEVDTTITNFYILDMKRKFVKGNKDYFGPLKEFQFDSLRTVFKIDQVPFDLNYPENP